MILITGAGGKTGRTLIDALVQRGEVVRAFVRTESHAAQVLAAGAQHAVIGDLRDGPAVHQAAQGVRAIYHICPNMHPDEVAIGRNVIDAAQAATVERFVCHSVLHPQAEAMPHHWNKLRVEELIFASGLPFTILQPTAYMQNLLAGWRAIVEHGVHSVPYPPETRISLVDLQDVAAVAATVLVDAGHLGATYELAGTAPLMQTEIAALLSEELVRPVTAERIPLATWECNARAVGMEEYARETLLQMFRYYERFGLIGNSNVLGWLLGRSPTSLREFMRRYNRLSNQK